MSMRRIMKVRVTLYTKDKDLEDLGLDIKNEEIPIDFYLNLDKVHGMYVDTDGKSIACVADGDMHVLEPPFAELLSEWMGVYEPVELTGVVDLDFNKMRKEFKNPGPLNEEILKRKPDDVLGHCQDCNQVHSGPCSGPSHIGAFIP